MGDKDVEARVKAAEEQNKKAQEEARKQVEESEAERLELKRGGVTGESDPTDFSFQQAAKDLEEREQPPNLGSGAEEAERQERDVRGETTTTRPKSAPVKKPE